MIIANMLDKKHDNNNSIYTSSSDKNILDTMNWFQQHVRHVHVLPDNLLS